MSFFSELTERICSTEFAADARHFLSPTAFTRSRKLPLPSLIAALLSMRGTSQQVMLDSFFGSLGRDGDLHRGVSDRAFAKARDHLSWNSLQRLNTFVVHTADRLGLIERWQGLRVVAADASVFFLQFEPVQPSRGLPPAPISASSVCFCPALS